MNIIYFGIPIKKIRDNMIFRLNDILFYASIDEAFNIIKEHNKQHDGSI
jgi:MFS superfamily sulfate permease-like transporter